MNPIIQAASIAASALVYGMGLGLLERSLVGYNVMDPPVSMYHKRIRSIYAGTIGPLGLVALASAISFENVSATFQDYPLVSAIGLFGDCILSGYGFYHMSSNPETPKKPPEGKAKDAVIHSSSIHILKEQPLKLSTLPEESELYA